MAVRYPIVPNNITIHLGSPTEAANNITVPFTDYISNVAASELYPTWPRNALIANIYAIISFALNRIYNEWYRSKGYNFDITSMQKDLANLENELQTPEIWSDQKKASELGSKIRDIKDNIEFITKWKSVLLRGYNTQ